MKKKNSDNEEVFELIFSTKSTVAQLSDVLYKVKTTSATKIQVSLEASVANDYMLFQLLVFLKKEGKSILIKWIDHEPSDYLQNMYTSLTN